MRCCSSSARAVPSADQPARRWCRTWCPTEHFVNAVTWGATVFQIANIAGPAVGGLLFTLAAGALGPAASGRSAGGLSVHTATLVGFLILIGMLHVRPGRMEHRATTFDLAARRTALCVAREAAAGIRQPGSVRRAAGRRGCADADLCRERAAHRRARPGTAACRAGAGCARLYRSCSPSGPSGAAPDA